LIPHPLEFSFFHQIKIGRHKKKKKKKKKKKREEKKKEVKQKHTQEINLLRVYQALIPIEK
jgi:hypothetical protein